MEDVATIVIDSSILQRVKQGNSVMWKSGLKGVSAAFQVESLRRRARSLCFPQRIANSCAALRNGSRGRGWGRGRRFANFNSHVKAPCIPEVPREERERAFQFAQFAPPVVSFATHSKRAQLHSRNPTAWRIKQTRASPFLSNRPTLFSTTHFLLKSPTTINYRRVQCQ